MSATTIAFVTELVNSFPRLSHLFKEHVEDNDEILPHIFLWDVTQHAVSLYLKVEAGRDFLNGELFQLLAFLENNYGDGEEEIQELISVSFLESLPRDEEPGSSIRSLMGPELKKQLEVIG